MSWPREHWTAVDPDRLASGHEPKPRTRRLLLAALIVISALVAGAWVWVFLAD